MEKRNNHITHRYYILGELELLSPMVIASGENEKADLQIIRDWDNNIFIPATTIAGNIKHLLVKTIKNEGKLWNCWGNSENSGHSLFSFYDAIGNNIKTDIRDGVKLDDITKTTEDGSKYDYEIINTGSEFNFRMTAVAREKTNKQELENILSQIIKILESENLRIGAKTSRGFGKVKLLNTKILKLDMSNENDKQKWIDFKWEELDSEDKLDNSLGLFDKINNFKIRADFVIPDSLIIKSYSKSPSGPDSVSLTLNDRPIVSGTSWNGAIRQALLNIGKDLEKEEQMKKLLENTFGWVDDKSQSKNAIPSKVIIEESIIENGKLLPYVRNKVDRFTGGVVDGALFDEVPVYGGELTLNCEMEKAKDYEIGMIILAIKEFENGIQTVGGGANIGRGRLELKSLNIIKEEEKKYLNALAKKLNEGE